jgi:hypothetical protein
LCLATLGEVDHLPLRATEGWLRSLVFWIGLALPVPDYTTLCRRRKQREVELPRSQKGKGLHLVVDSTGVKLYGEGEGKVRQHGKSKRRSWRKVHYGGGGNEERNCSSGGNDPCGVRWESVRGVAGAGGRSDRAGDGGRGV